MDRHVSAEALIDLAEGLGRAEDRTHLSSCDECRVQLDALRTDLLAIASVEVPEPAPMYWEAFRRQVGRRLEGEPRRRAWAWLWVPALAAVVAVVVLMRAPPDPHGRPHGVASLPAWSALPASDDDAGLSVLQALADGGQLGAAPGCDEVAACVEALSDEDVKALAEKLQGELGKGREL